MSVTFSFSFFKSSSGKTSIGKTSASICSNSSLGITLPSPKMKSLSISFYFLSIMLGDVLSDNSTLFKDSADI